MTSRESNEVRFLDPRDEQFAVLDDALDDLPRFYAVADQPKNGTLGFEAEPHMVCCVTVEDVREMLRRQIKGGQR